MTTGHVIITTILILLTSLTTTISHRLIRTTPQDHHHQSSGIINDEDGYCESWKFAIEANYAWNHGHSRRMNVKVSWEYMNGEKKKKRYRSDSEVIASYALAFAKNVAVGNDGKDVWVFDIDETLLSNLPYYVDHAVIPKANRVNNVMSHGVSDEDL
ncbi:acid phosphatase 1 [Tanacetum coccineum]